MRESVEIIWHGEQLMNIILYLSECPHDYNPREINVQEHSPTLTIEQFLCAIFV